MSRGQYYADEELLAPIREFEAENGRAPTKVEYTQFAEPAAETAAYRFGSWPAAIEAAGVERRREGW